ncbi:unnamed protein product [Rotaria socialis]|uniref:Hint domain-containing protein n=1 Tax=Rotaria socialis TaxID=392032 RepID=A0A818EFV4_9BILA|nr:unnamed protein product [Rotaria socialis]
MFLSNRWVVARRTRVRDFRDIEQQPEKYKQEDDADLNKYCCCCSVIALAGALIGLIIAGTALGIGIALLVKTSGTSSACCCQSSLEATVLATAETTNATDTTTPICFSADQHVTLANGQVISIQNLTAGDHVLTLSDDGKRFIASEVAFFIHAEMNRTSLFYTVTTESGQQISVTPDHYIRVENKGYIIASQLTLNYSLFVAHLNHPVRIRSIEKEFKVGLFSPVTFAGTILVNDVFASCYCLNNLRGTHYEKHQLYAPFRLWYYVAKYYLGFGSEVYEMPRDNIHWAIGTYVHYGHYVVFIYRSLCALFLVVLIEIFIRISETIHPILFEHSSYYKR